MKPIKPRTHTGLSHIGDLIPKVMDKYAGVLPTFYKGITFRARGEARWAVFMDTLGVKWQYEVNGYQFADGTRYLPDFWLPDLKCWIEIKGEAPTDEEELKARQLAELTKSRVYIFFGVIALPDGDTAPAAHAIFPDGGWDSSYMWCECEQCGTVGVQFDGRSDRLPCKECRHCWHARHVRFFNEDAGQQVKALRAAAEHLETCAVPKGCKRIAGNGDKGYATNTPRLLAAYTAALSERFGT